MSCSNLFFNDCFRAQSDVDKYWEWHFNQPYRISWWGYWHFYLSTWGSRWMIFIHSLWGNIITINRWFLFYCPLENIWQTHEDILVNFIATVRTRNHTSFIIARIAPGGRSVLSLLLSSSDDFFLFSPSHLMLLLTVVEELTHNWCYKFDIIDIVGVARSL